MGELDRVGISFLAVVKSVDPWGLVRDQDLTLSAQSLDLMT